MSITVSQDFTLEQPESDQVGGSAAPKIVHVLDLLQSSGKLTNQKYTISKLVVQAHVCVPFTFDLIQMKSGAPALQAPYWSHSRPLDDTGSKLLTQMRGQSGTGGYTVEFVSREKHYQVQVAPPSSSTAVEDLVIGLLFDMKKDVIGSLSRSAWWGMLHVSFEARPASGHSVVVPIERRNKRKSKPRAKAAGAFKKILKKSKPVKRAKNDVVSSAGRVAKPKKRATRGASKGRLALL